MENAVGCHAMPYDAIAQPHFLAHFAEELLAVDTAEAVLPLLQKEIH